MSLLLAAFLSLAPIGSSAAVPAGATVLDSDIVWDIWNPDSAAISPDGCQIAYISKGALWKCAVDQGPPVKLADLPRTSTAYMALPEFDYARTNFKRIRQTLGNAVYNKTIAREEVRVSSLAWTPSQSGVVYTLFTRRNLDAIYDVQHVSLSGTVTQVASIERNKWAEPRDFTRFYVLGDFRHVIAWSGNTPLIWNVAHGRFRATCFDLLVPAANSSKYLGVEIDTRQFVLVDEEFEIIERYDVFAPTGIVCDLMWSPDEQFAIFRRKDDHPSERWDGFRVELKTAKKRPLEGNFFTDELRFTGRGGEALRKGIVGVWYHYGDNIRGGFLEIIPDDDRPAQMIAKFRRSPKSTSVREMIERPPYPMPLANFDASLFAMAFPRAADQAAGYEYFLIDRRGGRWPLPESNSQPYIAPYFVVGFADGGRRIIAHDQSKLFSLPVSSVLSRNERSE